MLTLMFDENRLKWAPGIQEGEGGGGGEGFPPIFNYHSSWKIVEDFLQQEIMFGERGRK